jgi:hypothetical protein
MLSEGDAADGWESLTDCEWSALDEQCHGFSERRAAQLPAEARRGHHAPWCPTPHSGCVCDFAGAGY